MINITIPLFTFIFAISTGWILASEEQISANQSPEIPIHKLDELLKSSGGTGIHKILDQAIAAQRMDILKKCFENPHAARLFLANVNAKPNNDFKDKIVIMMLRAESVFWPAYQDPNQLSPDGSPRFNNYHLEEPFIGVFEKYFKGEELTKAMLERHTERLKLADKIELAMSGGAATLENKANVKSEQEMVTDLNGDESIKKSDTEGHDSSSGNIWVWITMGVVVIGISLRLLYRR